MRSARELIASRRRCASSLRGPKRSLQILPQDGTNLFRGLLNPLLLPLLGPFLDAFRQH